MIIDFILISLRFMIIDFLACAVMCRLFLDIYIYILTHTFLGCVLLSECKKAQKKLN